MRTTWGSIMTTVFLAILNNKEPIEIAAKVPAAALAAGLPESSLTALDAAISSSDYSSVPGITPAIEAAVGAALIDAYSAAYAYVYYAAVAVGGAGIIAVLFLRDFDKQMTTHVPRKLYAHGDESVSSRGDVENTGVSTALEDKEAGATASRPVTETATEKNEI